jgi:hypothetical protein
MNKLINILAIIGLIWLYQSPEFQAKIVHLVNEINYDYQSWQHFWGWVSQ